MYTHRAGNGGADRRAIDSPQSGENVPRECDSRNTVPTLDEDGNAQAHTSIIHNATARTQQSFVI